MKTIKKILCFWLWLVLTGFIFLALPLQNSAEAAWFWDDGLPPQVIITAPAPGATSYVTTKSVIILAGTADDDTAIKEITWENDRGGAGFADATTNWLGPWNWQTGGITLQPGNNIITITATDAADNEGTNFLLVTCNAPEPPFPPAGLKAIDLTRTKVKMDVYKEDSGYDHASIVTYLKKGSTETFVMPMNMDVTVTMKVPNPDNPSVLIPIYTETIPAGTIPYAYTRYRYTSGPPGIRELTFERSTSTYVYFYVSIDTVDFLANTRGYFLATDPGNFPGNYTTWLLGIKSLNFTVQTGNIAWAGNIPFTTGRIGSVTEYSHRVEYLYNR
jgi:hypothetical protein